MICGTEKLRLANRAKTAAARPVDLDIVQALWWGLLDVATGKKERAFGSPDSARCWGITCAQH